MPRHARLDGPGVLHHIIVRGIERRLIFRDDTDKERFVERLGKSSPIPTPRVMHGRCPATMPTSY
jgi:putative transposase